MEPTLRSAQVLKQEAEDLGYEGKEIMEYVKEQQKLDREERAAWRNIRMTELETEAEEKEGWWDPFCSDWGCERTSQDRGWKGTCL